MDSVYPTPRTRIEGKDEKRWRLPKPPNEATAWAIFLGFVAGSTYSSQQVDTFQVSFLAILFVALGGLSGYTCACDSSKFATKTLNAFLTGASTLLLVRISKDLLIVGKILIHSNIWDFIFNLAFPFFFAWFIVEWYFTSRK